MMHDRSAVKTGKPVNSRAYTKKEAAASGPRLDSRHYDIPGSIQGNVMHRQITRRGQKELIRWLRQEWRNQSAMAITLTFAAPSRRNTQQHLLAGKLKRQRKLKLNLRSRSALQGIVKGIHRDINRRAFKKAARRHDKKLALLVVWEGFQRGHPHCHCLIAKPRHMSWKRFEREVNEVLRKQPYVCHFKANKATNIGGWIGYVMKRRDKGDLLQDIDWELCHLPAV